MARKPDKATLETKHIPEEANRLRSGRLVRSTPETFWVTDQGYLGCSALSF